MNLKIFVKGKIIPDYVFDDISYDLKDITPQPSETKDGEKQGVDRTHRSSLSRKIKVTLYADLCKVLEDFCSEIHPDHIPQNSLILKELEHLQYSISDHFRPHNDALPNKDPKKIRRFTTVTLLSKTEDLEGGDLLVYDEDGNTINTNLEVGETVLFYSTTMHAVTPITKGGREVLVGWIYDR